MPQEWNTLSPTTLQQRGEEEEDPSGEEAAAGMLGEVEEEARMEVQAFLFTKLLSSRFSLMILVVKF